MYILETKQVSMIDQYLCNHGYTIMELIQKAAKALYKHVKAYQRPLIIAGFGNNGADGLALAHLFINNGKSVDVYLYKKDLMNVNCKQLVQDLTIINQIDLDQYDVIIDGVFGAGLNRPIEKELSLIFEQVNQSTIQKYSIDIPSGISGDGIIYDHYFHCDHVITFMGLKKLYLIQEFHHYFHDVILETLDIDEEVFQNNHIAKLIDEDYAINHLKFRHYNDYKNKNGVIMHITGCEQYTGAMIMAASGSIYSGSGILKVCTNEKSKAILNQHFPEAIYQSRDHIEYHDDAYLIGSGLSQSQEAEELVYHLLTDNHKPVVIDGDGLNILAKHLDWLKNRSCEVVLTPHLGEYKRLDPIGDIDAFVSKYQCIVILKGPQTKIISPEYTYINSTGNKSMAIGGSGDTLAGIVVSLIGQGYPMIVACNLAVYFHGRAGDELAKENYMVLPSELAKQVGKEMRKVELLREK